MNHGTLGRKRERTGRLTSPKRGEKVILSVEQVYMPYECDIVCAWILGGKKCYLCEHVSVHKSLCLHDR